MDQIIANLLSPGWWLTVVFGTIVLHIVAFRINAWIPKFFFKISEVIQRRSKNVQQWREARRYAVKNVPGVREYYLHRAGQLRHSSTHYFLFAVLFVSIYVGIKVAQITPDSLDEVIEFTTDARQTVKTIYQIVCLFGFAVSGFLATMSNMNAAEIVSDVRRVVFNEEGQEPNEQGVDR